MDELDVVLKARSWLREIPGLTVPVPMETYLSQLGAELRVEGDLGPDEPGWSVMKKGTPVICVNAKDSQERQRFTICHELAHFILRIKSDHARPSWSYKKPLGEIYCDVFAAELLLPHPLFKPAAEASQITFASLDSLGEQFLASVTAVGSRFAALLSDPCAFVLCEQGKVRYAARSSKLRECGAWISPGIEVPNGSVTDRLRRGESCNQPEGIDADNWFRDWERGGTLLEEARHLHVWDQTLTLLWFEDLEVPDSRNSDAGFPARTPQDELLPELDGILRFKPRVRRR